MQVSGDKVEHDGSDSLQMRWYSDGTALLDAVVCIVDGERLSIPSEWLLLVGG
jgi:hypothetical protein